MGREVRVEMSRVLGFARIGSNSVNIPTIQYNTIPYSFTGLELRVSNT